MTSIEALSPVFGADCQGDRFCVTSKGQHKLVQLGARLAGDTQALVGLYVTESAEPEYNADSAQYGRVVALVRMLQCSRVRRFTTTRLDAWGFGAANW